MKTLQTLLLALALSAISLTAAAQCDASFTYDTVNGGVRFSATNYYQHYHWDFGQGPGDTSNLRNPTFGYASTGTYNVCLTVANTDTAPTCTNTQCMQVIVTPCALAANRVTVGYTYVNTRFNLTFTSTSTGANLPLSYNWSFTNGTPGTSTSANPSVNYPTTGHIPQTAPVYLTVVDALGCSASLNDAINVVGNYPCMAQIDYYSTALATYTFADSLELTGYNYLWTFGDGATSTSSQPTHTYATNGNYNVCLAVSSTNPACADTICTNLHAQVCGTVASFTDTLSGPTGNTVTCTSTSTTLNPPLTYEWAFTGSSPNSGTGLSAATITTGGGSEVISLTVTDATGCHDSTRATVSYGPQGPFQIHAETIDGGCPAELYLILEDSTGHLVLVDSLAEGDSSGTCYGATFTTTIPGTYFVKGALTTANSNYAGYLPTYYTNAISWVDATPQYVSDIYAYYNYPITMQAGVNTGGPGFIGGYVSEGAGLDVHPGRGGSVNDPKSLGDALAGIQINLTTDAGQAVAYTHTDANGHYQFPNLAYGTYVVFTDVINSKPSPVTITLSAQNPSDSVANDSVQQSAVTGITDLTTFSLDRVYPDPVVSNVTLAITSAAETNATLKLVDMLGRTQIQKPVTLATGQNTFVMPMDEVANGVYQLLLQTTTKTIAYKLVKVK